MHQLKKVDLFTETHFASFQVFFPSFYLLDQLYTEIKKLFCFVFLSCSTYYMQHLEEHAKKCNHFKAVVVVTEHGECTSHLNSFFMCVFVVRAAFFLYFIVK